MCVSVVHVKCRRSRKTGFTQNEYDLPNIAGIRCIYIENGNIRGHTFQHERYRLVFCNHFESSILVNVNIHKDTFRHITSHHITLTYLVLKRKKKKEKKSNDINISVMCTDRSGRSFVRSLVIIHFKRDPLLCTTIERTSYLKPFLHCQ